MWPLSSQNHNAAGQCFQLPVRQEAYCTPPACPLTHLLQMYEAADSAAHTADVQGMQIGSCGAMSAQQQGNVVPWLGWEGNAPCLTIERWLLLEYCEEGSLQVRPGCPCVALAIASLGSWQGTEAMQAGLA